MTTEELELKIATILARHSAQNISSNAALERIMELVGRREETVLGEFLDSGQVM